MTSNNPAPHLPLTPEWQALGEHLDSLQNFSLKQAFAEDPFRADTLTIEAAGLRLDYSKNLITRDTLPLLLALAEASDLEQAILDMFVGEPINNTEHRAALHVTLRSPFQMLEEEREVHQALEQMEKFVDSVHAGTWQGYTGKGITDVVNIGIGGSDLGPAMVYSALAPFHIDGLRCHFVSNVDPAHLSETLSTLQADHTLFVIASKTFTTLETLQNANAAREWFLDQAGNEEALPRHFVAVSSNIEKASAFGIHPDNIFPMWDWVGGRYSLWSAIGLPVALGMGMRDFRDLLAGAHAMDEHFRTAELHENLPVIMGLLAVWYLDVHGAESQAVLPYLQDLHLFPAFLQQLDMESLGKSVKKDGSPITGSSGGIVWGSAGTNGQHSFHQLLHQGTHLIPADFITAAHSHYDADRHFHLLANCFAQSQALMEGKTLEAATQDLIDKGMPAEEARALAPHKVVPGNRPSNTILMETLTPLTLGSLIAAYEQKVYVQSVVLGINAFDQWGVELGKVLGTGVHKALVSDQDSTGFDGSTNALINFCRHKKSRELAPGFSVTGSDQNS